MKTLEYIDVVAKPVVQFVLRILGAFGACWGTFSAVEIVREQFFHGSKDNSLMNNPIYSKVALGVSLTAAGISTYVLIREKLGASNIPSTSYGTEEIAVMVPLCSSSNLRQQQLGVLTTPSDLEAQSSEQLGGNNNASATEVFCRKKPS